METITLLPEQPYAIDGHLTITVLHIVEIWLPPDRQSIMSIYLHMKTPEKEEKITFTSNQQNLIWEGYEFEYLGGWRDEVRLKLKRIKTDSQE